VDRVPAVGGARGVFEIFVPGAFLFLNLVTTTYLWPFTSDPVRDQLASLYTNTSAFLLASITLGYLLGVILRLLRSEMPDRLSAGFLRLTDRSTYGGETDKNRWSYERFPFTRWQRTVCKDRMPPGVLHFYETVWARRDSGHFFNLCKLIVACEDPKAAEEVYSSEALCRHISGMFYALTASLAAMLSVEIAIWVSRGSPSFVVTFVALVYLVAIVVILSNFRLMRLKEVGTVFAASYRNRERIEDALKAGATEGAEHADAADAASPRR
jgi:hypothetical protein